MLIAVFLLLLGIMGGISGSGSSGTSSAAVPTTTPDTGMAKVPKASSSFTGENYDNVRKMLEGAGFTNIVLTPHDDLKKGCHTKRKRKDGGSVMSTTLVEVFSFIW